VSSLFRGGNKRISVTVNDVCTADDVASMDDVTVGDASKDCQNEDDDGTDCVQTDNGTS
jgi:hypothetical protein